jgi:acyl-CoA-binding protein
LEYDFIQKGESCPMKFAEVGKPKSKWELQELLRLTALIMDSWKEDNQYEKPGIIGKKHLVLFGSTGKLF